MIEDWDDLDFWENEWEIVRERLGNVPKLSPSIENLFRALYLTPFDKVKCLLMGQDPYPDPVYATGVAFSIPAHMRRYPPTLQAILREYCTDLHYKRPANGCLEVWAKQGVLLWNAIPSCTAWNSLSHLWPEWKVLTTEIVNNLQQKGIVFVFTGAIAREFAPLVGDKSCIIETSHPSPRGSMNSKVPFIGSRIFTRVNDLLVQELGLDPIDWYLDEPPTKRQESNVTQHRRIYLDGACVETS